MRLYKTSSHFYKGGSRFIVLIYVCTSACVRSRHEDILILGRTRHWKWTRGHFEAANFAEILCF